MADFQLDTSGFVACVPHGPTRRAGGATIIWSDLSPFTQGYVEAALQSFDAETDYPRRFSWLAPETLAQMIADCDLWKLRYAIGPDAKGAAALFWKWRQGGKLGGSDARDFPPLALYLGDDGKVCAKPAA